MRKRYRVLLLATIVVAFVVPFGSALSLEPSHRLRLSNVVSEPFVPAISDGAQLTLIGTTFLALAAAVKRIKVRRTTAEP